MAHMTDAQHKTVGHTVLYVPDEGSAMASAEAHMDKELVQRLEGEMCMILTINNGVGQVSRLIVTTKGY